MGSGKSHWAKALSERLNLPSFDLDEQIVNAEGRTVNEIFEQEGEEAFRLKEKDLLHIITESHGSFIMACGGGTPCYFNNIEYMNQSGTTVWLNTPINTIVERLLTDKAARPLLRDLPDSQMKSFITRKFSDRRIYYEQAQIRLDHEPTIEEFIEKVFHA